MGGSRSGSRRAWTPGWRPGEAGPRPAQAEAPQVRLQEGLGRASAARLKQRDWQAHRLVPGTVS